MSDDATLIDSLKTLNQIAESLNRAVDVRGALNGALARLIKVMGLETGWIFLRDEMAQDRWYGKHYLLAAHHNLPPAMSLENPEAWHGGCDCQGFCNQGKLTEAYNEVRCSRLASVSGDRRGLAVHASAPLYSGEQMLGILNVAAPNWDAFSPEALALLTNVGNQMGVALERARLFDMVRSQRIHEQSALLELSHRLLRRSDLDEMIYGLVEDVQRLLDVDACALLLPARDKKELVFRAAVGWSSDLVGEGRRVPADERSGSGQVMLTQQPLVVLAGDDYRAPFWSTDWVAEEKFKAAVMVPLVVDGRSVGVMVIDSRQPRRFDQEEIRFLQLMANQAAIAIEKARLHKEELQRQRLEQDLVVARQIQLSLLPKSDPVIPGWQVASIYRAARQVGGDFYDFFELKEDKNRGRIGLVIADVTDKGVPAALFMAMCRTMIRTTAFSGRSPADALTRANELILQDSQSDLFLSVFYAILDPATGWLQFANAGHSRPLWYCAATGCLEELDTDGIVLGVLEDIELEQREIEVAPGDILIFFTDGVTEAMAADYEEYGLERLYQAVQRDPLADANQILRNIVDDVNSFTANMPQSDDFTLFVVKRDA